MEHGFQHGLALRPLTLGQPLRWLRAGWADFLRSWPVGLAHGAAVALFALALLVFAGNHFWVLTSAALITALSPEAINSPAAFLRHVVASREHYLFELWLMLGGVLAAPVFASSVITLPLLLDRQVSVPQAVMVSWLAVIRNPAAMACWAALIMVLSLAGMAALLLGCLVVVPVLGHASWHAYRDTLDASLLPERVRRDGGRTTEALIASMLPPEKFGQYYATGHQYKPKGQAIFFEIDPSFRDEFFELDEAFRRCVAHPDGTPKNSVYAGVYRVLEHIPVKALGKLYLSTAYGHTLALDRSEIAARQARTLHLYQNLAPVNSLVVSSLDPVGYYQGVTTQPAKFIRFPGMCFVDLDLGALAADPAKWGVG